MGKQCVPDLFVRRTCFSSCSFSHKTLEKKEEEVTSEEDEEKEEEEVRQQALLAKKEKDIQKNKIYSRCPSDKEQLCSEVYAHQVP